MTSATTLPLAEEPSSPRTVSQVLISGGTGFFGKALLRYLLSKAGTKNNKEQIENAGRLAPPGVTIISRDPEAFLGQHPEFRELSFVRWVQADLTSPESEFIGALDKTIGTQSFSHILHAATESTLGPQLSHSSQFNQIVEGTRSMLAAAKYFQARRFLLTSSGGVYGVMPSNLDAFPESHLGMPDPLDPRSAYSLGKRMSEHLCALAASDTGLEVVITRPFAFCGPDLPLDVHFAIGNFIRDALSKNEILVRGDGSPIRSYLDQDDLAHWLMTMLFNGKPGQAYNIGSDQGISIGDLAHKVRDLLAPNKPVVIQGTPNPAIPRQVYLPDITKARKDLGLALTVSLEESIVKTARTRCL